MGRVDTPWGYKDQVLITQVDVGGERGMLGIHRIVINGDEQTSYAKHENQAEIIYLEKGEATLRIEGKMEELQKGEARVIRSGEKHQIQNINDEVAEILELSFPYKPEDVEKIEDPYDTEE